jgi:DNA-directed RNA polymerase subunit RPC12/RpoP
MSTCQAIPTRRSAVGKALGFQCGSCGADIPNHDVMTNPESSNGDGIVCPACGIQLLAGPTERIVNATPPAHEEIALTASF